MISQILSNPVGCVLLAFVGIKIIGVIGYCIFLKRNGESAFEGLVPFLHLEAFGNICGDILKGCETGVFGLLGFLGIAAFTALSFYENNYGSLLSQIYTKLILTISFAIWFHSVVSMCELRNTYLENEYYKKWINILWFIFPTITHYYLAFTNDDENYFLRRDKMEKEQEEKLNDILTAHGLNC